MKFHFAPYLIFGMITALFAGCGEQYPESHSMPSTDIATQVCSHLTECGQMKQYFVSDSICQKAYVSSIDGPDLVGCGNIAKSYSYCQSHILCEELEPTFAPCEYLKKDMEDCVAAGDPERTELARKLCSTGAACGQVKIEEFGYDDEPDCVDQVQQVMTRQAGRGCDKQAKDYFRCKGNLSCDDMIPDPAPNPCYDLYLDMMACAMKY